MAYGNNHAKKIVIEQAEALGAKLEANGAKCVETQGQAIGLLIKMVTTMYAADFVTIEDCIKRHDKNVKEENKLSRIKMGPVELEGRFGPVAILCIINFIFMGSIIFVVGKTEQWW